MRNVHRDLSAWLSLQSVPGLGPKRLLLLARALEAASRGAGSLLGADHAELSALGLPRALASRASEALGTPTPPLEVPPGVRIVCVDDEPYPRERSTETLPLPSVLYAQGNVDLLTRPGIAIAGARSAPEIALRYAFELAGLAAKEGLNVVAGHAAGADEAGHAGALAMAGTTTAVLAEGICRFRPRGGLAGAPEDSVLIVSGFEPEAPWTPQRAMARNTAIAALADVVVVVAAGTSGGSWAQGGLCLKAGRLLLVPEFPPDVAPGNAELIRRGAVPVDPGAPSDALGHMEAATRAGAEQMRLLG